jgi:hypothetical protein
MLNTRQARVDMDAGGKAASTTVEDTLFARGGKERFLVVPSHPPLQRTRR